MDCKLGTEDLKEINAASYLKLAHITLIATGQFYSKPNIGSSYTEKLINSVKCIEVNLGHFLDVAKQTLFLPWVSCKILSMKILYSAHVKHTTLGKTFHRQINGTIGQSRSKPLFVFIPDAQRITRKLTENCSQCSKARKLPYKSIDTHYKGLIRSRTNSFFTAITLDLIPVSLKWHRNNKKQHYVLIIVDILTHCVELILLEDQKEQSIINELIILQQNYNCIQYILTDRGSQLCKFEIAGYIPKKTEEIRLFALLKEAKNAASKNQQSNLCEAYCKKFKFLCRSISSLSYKTYFSTLTRQEFRVLLAYFKSAMESVPYEANSNVTPKSLRGQSIVFPLELQTETNLKTMSAVKEKVVDSLELFLKDLHAKESSLNSNFYNKKCRSNCVPAIHDVAMVKDESLKKEDRIAVVTAVNTNTVTLRFSNGRSNEYPNNKVFLICRPPKALQLMDSEE